MKIKLEKLEVQTRGYKELIDITPEVKRVVQENRVSYLLCPSNE